MLPGRQEQPKPLGDTHTGTPTTAAAIIGVEIEIETGMEGYTINIFGRFQLLCTGFYRTDSRFVRKWCKSRHWNRLGFPEDHDTMVGIGLRTWVKQNALFPNSNIIWWGELFVFHREFIPSTNHMTIQIIKTTIINNLVYTNFHLQLRYVCICIDVVGWIRSECYTWLASFAFWKKRFHRNNEWSNGARVWYLHPVVGFDQTELTWSHCANTRLQFQWTIDSTNQRSRNFNFGIYY